MSKDILGKVSYYIYFKNSLEDLRKIRYLKGTIFEAYVTIFNFYKTDKLNSKQVDILIHFLELSFKISDWSKFDYLWISFYKKFKKRKINFKGLNFIFKLILIK